jgi:hypothetical protein
VSQQEEIHRAVHQILESSKRQEDGYQMYKVRGASLVPQFTITVSCKSCCPQKLNSRHLVKKLKDNFKVTSE